MSEIAVSGAYVKVTVSNDQGQSREVYTLNVSAKNDKQYDISDIAKGSKKIFVTAEMSGPYISADTGTTGFLQCTRNDSGVFEVTAQIADPLKAVNQVLANSSSSGTVPNQPTEPATEVSATEKAINAVADNAFDSNDGVFDMISKIQEGSKRLTWSIAVSPDMAFNAILKYVQDALTFDGTKLTQTASTEIVGWWSRLKVDDRRRFARHFALQCAYARGKQK